MICSTSKANLHILNSDHGLTDNLDIKMYF